MIYLSIFFFFFFFFTNYTYVLPYKTKFSSQYNKFPLISLQRKNIISSYSSNPLISLTSPLFNSKNLIFSQTKSQRQQEMETLPKKLELNDDEIDNLIKIFQDVKEFELLFVKEFINLLNSTSSSIHENSISNLPSSLLEESLSSFSFTSVLFNINEEDDDDFIFNDKLNNIKNVDNIFQQFDNIILNNSTNNSSNIISFSEMFKQIEEINKLYRYFVRSNLQVLYSLSIQYHRKGMNVDDVLYNGLKGLIYSIDTYKNNKIINYNDENILEKYDKNINDENNIIINNNTNFLKYSQDNIKKMIKNSIRKHLNKKIIDLKFDKENLFFINKIKWIRRNYSFLLGKLIYLIYFYYI